MKPLRVTEMSILEENLGIVKRFTGDYFKVTAIRCIRKRGFVPVEYIDTLSGKELEKHLQYAKIKPKEKRERDNTAEKSPESVSRTRRLIFELSMCNEWELFITLTLDAEKMDRYDLEAYKKKLGQFLDNYRRRQGVDVRYVLIPEEHKDGAWHIHGLLMGLPMEHLTRFTLGDDIPRKMKQKIRSGVKLYNWLPYAERFGWVCMEPIRNKEACSKYITKYITKAIEKSRIAANDKLYYCSKGLKRPEEVYRGTLIQDFTPDYEPDNNYVKTKRCHKLEDALILFTNLVPGDDGILYGRDLEEFEPIAWKVVPPKSVPDLNLPPKPMPVYRRGNDFYGFADDDGELPEGWTMEDLKERLMRWRMERLAKEEAARAEAARLSWVDVWVEQLRLA